MNPPAVADDIANAALDAASNGAANNPSSQAGKAVKRLKVALCGNALGNVTTPELGHQAAFAARMTMRNAVNVGLDDDAPLWAVQLTVNMNNRFDEMNEGTNNRFDEMNEGTNNRFDEMNEGTNNRFDEMNEGTNNRFDEMNNRFDQVDNRLNRIEARQLNANAVNNNDPIQPLADAAGNIPVNFPATKGAFGGLTPNQIRGFLEFYGLPANPAASAEHRLSRHLGFSR
jgi:hypothetical protein